MIDKNIRGGVREGAGRKNLNKIKLMFGYKYTPEEYEEMKSSLDKLKTETGKTTSRLLYEFLTGKREG
ncbi:MAG: hypothetical protein ACRCU6_00240 [Fusobacteriaceae bacterium]